MKQPNEFDLPESVEKFLAAVGRKDPVVFVSDGVASFTPELHKAGLVDIAVAFGRVMSSAGVINEIESSG